MRRKSCGGSCGRGTTADPRVQADRRTVRKGTSTDGHEQKDEKAVGLSRTRARHPEALTGHPTVRHSVDTMLQEERGRWAMQIHDGLTQSVTSAVLELQTLRHRIETDPAGAVEALKEVETEIRNDLRRIRELLFSMTSVEMPREPSAFATALPATAAPTTITVGSLLITTSPCRSSSETSRSAWTPANERETAEARSDPPGLPRVSV